MSVERAAEVESHAEAPATAPEHCGAAGGYASAVLALQRTAGNRATGAWLARHAARPQRRIARAVPFEFQITDRRVDAADVTHIYFERGDDSLHFDEQLKLAKLVADNPAGTPLTLKGLRSEDEDPALATTRIAAVEAAMFGFSGLGPLTKVPLPNAGVGRIDYRRARIVEVVAGSRESTEPDCLTTPARFPSPPAIEAIFGTTVTRAKGFLDFAVGKLVAPRTPETRSLLTEYFKSAAPTDADKIRANLVKIKAQVELLADASRHESANQCDGHCGAGAIAYVNDDGAAAKLTICQGFDARDPDDRARNLIHEAAHATPDLAGRIPGKEGTIDRAYRHERMIKLVSKAEAMQNSDSYALLVLRLNGVTPASTPATDTPVGKISAGNFEKAHHSLALVEKWLTWAMSDVAGTYDTIKDSKPPAAAWSNSFYEDVMKLIATRFTGVTAPPALPTNDDQMIVAGIEDRLQALSKAAKRSMEVEQGSQLEWEMGLGKKLTVTSEWLAKGPETRGLALLDRLLHAATMIPGAQEAAYKGLINECRKLH